jgi:uncharacterized phage-associated protein
MFGFDHISKCNSLRKEEHLVMYINIYREKLLNAVLFFAKETKHANTTKISKLLCFFDFSHFKQTGYPSIGLKYYAFEKGPVPKDFWLEIKDGKVPEDFKGKLALVLKKEEFNSNFKEIEFRARTNADLSIFTPREIKILKDLALVFRDVRAWEISEISHLPNQPWHITREQKGENSLIDYSLVINEESDSDVDSESAKESLKEHFEIVNNFSLEPTK